jgi:2-desacetyl-2-hydroxyethyl bacteriochlorophyllide A dehydrogenase
MQTIVLEEPGRFVLADTAEPEAPGPGEALVRVRRVGICGTDLHAYRGKQPFFSYPRILGHELGVEVIALGSASDTLRVGDRCAVEPYLNCGECIACRQGRTNCCAHLKVLGVHIDGGMRSFVRVPMAKLHRSETLSLEQLALVETLGIGAHAVDRARIEPGEFALVIGTGPIGLSVLQFAQAAGAQVIALDTNAHRLTFARERMGVAHGVLAQHDSLATIAALTGGDLPTVVFDATGNPESMQNAFQYVAPGGRLVFVGLFLGSVSFYDPDFHRKEMTLLATRNSTGKDFQRILSLLEAGKVDTEPWITHRADAAEMTTHFPGWLEPENRVLKAVVTF